jgi:hypothetical protein
MPPQNVFILFVRVIQLTPANKLNITFNKNADAYGTEITKVGKQKT